LTSIASKITDSNRLRDEDSPAETKEKEKTKIQRIHVLLEKNKEKLKKLKKSKSEKAERKDLKEEIKNIEGVLIELKTIFRTERTDTDHKEGLLLAQRDTQLGNTVLHVLAMKGNIEMYNYIITEYEEMCDACDLENMTNNAGHTPLALAATLGQVEFFDYIMKRRRLLHWEYGDLEAYLYPLREIDTSSHQWISRGQLGALELVVYNCPTYFDDHQVAFSPLVFGRGMLTPPLA